MHIICQYIMTHNSIIWHYDTGNCVIIFHYFPTLPNHARPVMRYLCTTHTLDGQSVQRCLHLVHSLTGDSGDFAQVCSPFPLINLGAPACFPGPRPFPGNSSPPSRAQAPPRLFGTDPSLGTGPFRRPSVLQTLKTCAAS